MKIIEPEVYIAPDQVIDPVASLRKIESAYRICYRSEGKMADDKSYNVRFIEDKIRRGHESPLEHESISFVITTDRGVTHELVRHRIASYSQESTRYCNYGDGNIRFIRPSFWVPESPVFRTDFSNFDACMAVWFKAVEAASRFYNELLDLGALPQEARAVLPNSTATSIMFTANLREYRHFLKLRMAPTAHPQMREVAKAIGCALRILFPPVFSDIISDEGELINVSR